jgi:hypothetical protein
MRPAGFAVAISLLGAAGSAMGACAPDEPGRITDTLRSMFAAASIDDLPRLNEIFAPGFYAYDGGKRFDGLALPALISKLHADGKRFVWTVQDADVHISCTTAWVAYVNRGAVGDAAAMKPMTWLESAVLTYQDDTWRVQFLHSTRVADPAAK